MKLLHNSRSPNKTAASLAFDLHYAQLNVIGRWDRNRYDRLCHFVQLTRHELASLIHWPHSHVQGALERNEFPGPVALLLTILEAQLMHKISADVIKNPFPKNGQ